MTIPLQSPSKHLAPTKSDSTTYVGVKAIVCLTAGNAVVQDRAASAVTYPMTAGQYLPVPVYKLMAASTGTYALIF